MEKIVRTLLLSLVLFYALPIAAQHKLSINLNEYSYPVTNALSISSKTFIIRGQGLQSDLTVTSTNPRFRPLVTTIDRTAIDPEEGYQLTVYFEPLILGEQKADLVITDATASKSVQCTLWGIANTFQPLLKATGIPKPFNTTLFTPSGAQTVTIKGEHLSTNITLNITAPTGFEVSTDDQLYAPLLTLDAATVCDVSLTLYIRLNAPFVSSFTGNLKIELSDFSCPSLLITLVGKIGKSTPVLQESPIVSQNLTLGDPLGNVELLGGKVVNGQGQSLAGKFRWVMGDDYNQLPVGVHELKVYFQPDYSYGYESVETTVSLRVLATQQEIIWMQDFSQPLLVGQEIKLNATASSGLPIRYLSDNPELALIDEHGLLKAQQAGHLRIAAFQDGDKTYQEAWGIAYFIDIKDPEASNPSEIKAFWDHSTQALQISTEERSVVRLFDTYGTLLLIREVIGDASLNVPTTHAGILILNVQNNNHRLQLKFHPNHDY